MRRNAFADVMDGLLRKVRDSHQRIHDMTRDAAERLSAPPNIWEEQLSGDIGPEPTTDPFKRAP